MWKAGMTALPLAPGTLHTRVQPKKGPLGRNERHRLVAEALRDLLAVVNSAAASTRFWMRFWRRPRGFSAAMAEPFTLWTKTIKAS